MSQRRTSQTSTTTDTPDDTSNQTTDTSSQTDKTQGDDTGLAVQGTGQAVIQPKAPNPYEFSDAEKKAFGSFDMNTDIARAWSRLGRRNLHAGKPLEAEQTQEDGSITQDFQYATAITIPNNDDNPNHVVSFKDMRGTVGTDSGL